MLTIPWMASVRAACAAATRWISLSSTASRYPRPMTEGPTRVVTRTFGEFGSAGLGGTIGVVAPAVTKG